MFRTLVTYLLGVAIGFAACLVIVFPNLPTHCPEGMECYKPYGVDVTPEYILMGTIVRVHFLEPSEITLPDTGESVAGYSTYELDPQGRPFSWCQIYVPMPTQVLGDAAMDTIGHELLHCVTGDFHPGE